MMSAIPQESVGSALRPLEMQHTNLRDRAYEAIRAAIVTKEIPPGARVSEAKLAATLDVSKTPIREALVRLTAIGLLEHDGRSGPRVPQPSAHSIRSAYDLREGLEVQSARLAAALTGSDPCATAAEEAELCLQAALSNDGDGFRQGDRRFHFAVAEATGNVYLADGVRNAYDLAWSLRLRDAPVVGFNVECARDHLSILEAIEAHDDALAGERMRAHVSKVKDTVLGTYTKLSSSS